MREYLKFMKGPREMARLVPSPQGHAFWSNCSCRHGLVRPTDLRFEEEIVTKFTNDFNTFLEDCPTTPLMWANTVQMAYRTAAHATFIAHDVMWQSQSHDRIVSFLLACGTQHLLDGNISNARDCAFIACSYQQFYRTFIHKTHPNENIPKLIEMYLADDHTLVSFYHKKRITCSCLYEKYKKVKSIPKMGICFNEFCCKTSLERQTMCCSRCRVETYCSRECQSDHWKFHKIICDVRRKRIESFTPLVGTIH